MDQYRPLLDRAIEKLPDWKDAKSRQNVYNIARQTLLQRLRDFEPQIEKTAVEEELRSLNRQIEECERFFLIRADGLGDNQRPFLKDAFRLADVEIPSQDDGIKFSDNNNQIILREPHIDNATEIRIKDILSLLRMQVEDTYELFEFSENQFPHLVKYLKFYITEIEQEYNEISHATLWGLGLKILSEIKKNESNKNTGSDQNNLFNKDQEFSLK